MSSSLFTAAVLALAFTDAASATLEYTLAAADTYSGTSFWDGFNFITDSDPNFGFVSYQSKAVAQSNHFGGPLIATLADGSNYMGVDYWNEYLATQGRPSVRIETKKSYQYGLFVADLAHMPASVCGTWPAFWTVNHVNYPSNGEIDILENISENTQSLQTLHTTAGCSVVGNNLGQQQNGTQNSYNCDNQATISNFGTQSLDQGCSATNSDDHSYGSAFNAISGGVYAMEWTNEVIQIWNFAPHKIPSNLLSGNPDTSTWGIPQFTTAHGTCDIDSHFKDQQVVFNTDFCGTFAGQAFFWEQTSCFKSNPNLYPDCNSYVAANPAVYKDAYWQIKSLKVYQKTNVVTSSSSTTSHTSTSSISDDTSTSFPSSTPIPSSGTSVGSLSSSSSVRYSNTSLSATSTGPSTTPYTTSTVYSTRTSTISECAETVTNCPYKTHPLTTVIVDVYTTVCPVSAKETSSGVVSSKEPDSSQTLVSAPASAPTVAIIHAETIKPMTSVSKPSNATIPAGTAGAPVVKTSSAGGVSAPSQSPIFSSGTGERTAKSALAIFLAGVVLLV